MNDFGSKIYDAAKKAVKEVYDLDVAEGQLVVETPQDTKLGDYSTSIAMKLSRTLRRNPMEIAEPLTAKLAELLPECESITVARPGFINFKLKASALTAVINDVITAGDDYGKNESGKGKHLLLEWVSANPTGDLHCGHARNAAWGDCIARMMEASGWDVLREFYVNDAGNQIVMLGESLTARYFEHFGKEYPLPEGGYHADDIKGIAAQLAEEEGDKWLTADPKERLAHFMDYGKRKELEKIDRDLKAYRVTMQSWMHETFFYENNAKRINDCLQHMADMGLTYEKDGALWFKSTDYGDDKDRVLRKSDGTFSYLTPDIAIKLAARYPELVKCLYLDAPVVNYMSCPCGFGIGNPLNEDYSEILNALQLKSISELLAYRNMPLDKLGILTKNRIPAVLVAGDSDTTVPYCENGIFLERAYKEAGVELEVYIVPGKDHHPHGLKDPRKVVDFVMRYCI